jgi:inorganic triphosphatase YgiF
MNPNTATREELVRWIVAHASYESTDEWAEAHLARAYTEAELRDMSREVAEYGEVRGKYGRG